MDREAWWSFNLPQAAGMVLVALAALGMAASARAQLRQAAPLSSQGFAGENFAAAAQLPSDVYQATLRASALSAAAAGRGAPFELAQAQSVTTAARDAQASGGEDPADFHDAEVAFPKFCQEWAEKLRRREVNNLEHIKWREQNGYETGTYVGYGPIQACTCKRSSKGFPVGKVSYQEEVFYLVGHSIDEAKHSKPKVVGTTSTLELFNWNHHHWQY
jgi:hypothetical protein